LDQTSIHIIALPKYFLLVFVEKPVKKSLRAMHSGSTVLKHQDFRAKGIDLKPALCNPRKPFGKKEIALFWFRA
jgi:hypothetical protein